MGVLVQFGGQTAIILADAIATAGFPVVGSLVETIDAAEDRQRCQALLRRLRIPQPAGGSAASAEEALKIAAGRLSRRGAPLLCPRRQGDGDCPDTRGPAQVCRALLVLGLRGAILVDKYLVGRELDVDAVSDGETVVIPGILEQLEPSGVHSADSFAAYPPVSLSKEETDLVVAHAIAIGRELRVADLMIQFVIGEGASWVLEVNPRASRTVPFLSKVSGVPMVKLATPAALGHRLTAGGLSAGLLPDRPLHAVKAPVFSTSKLPGIDPRLGLR